MIMPWTSYFDAFVRYLRMYFYLGFSMKRITCFSTLVFFLLLSCGESDETRMQRFLIQGNEKIREQEYEQAEKLFLSALRLDTCFADALNNLGTVEQRRKNYDSAIRYYSRAIRCDDGFFLAYINRANAYFENSQFPQALSDAKRAETIFPDSVTTLEIQALTYWKMHKEENAAGLFREILSRKPSDLNTLINLGTLYTFSKHYDSASYFLDRASSVKEDDPRIFNARAMLAASAGDPLRGLQWIDQALNAVPDDAYFQNNKGYILLLLQRYDESIDLINQSIAADPYNGWAYRNKGIYYFKKEKFGEALRLLKMAEKMDSGIEDLQAWIGHALVANKQIDEGCAYLQEATQLGQLRLDQMPSECD